MISLGGWILLICCLIAGAIVGIAGGAWIIIRELNKVFRR